MANAASSKKLLKTAHTWIGIVAGLFLSVVALTGSVILFRAEFERAALPSGTAAADHRLTIDEAAAQVAAMRQDGRIRRVQIPGHAGDPYIFQVQGAGKRTERIAVDSASGQVLGVIRPGWMDWMVDLHRNLLTGTTGRSIVGVIGVILLVLALSGLLMWLTGVRNWRSWISVRRGSTIRFNYELHRASGLWAFAFLAVIAFTGIERSFPNAFRDSVQALTGKPATMAAPKKVKGDLKLSIGEYVKLASRAMPDGIPVELRLPDAGKGPVDLRLYRSGDLSPSGNHVYLDPTNGSVAKIDRIVDRPLGARFLASMAPIHYGQFGGMPMKIAWALLALSPLLLFATGLMAWWRPRPKAKQLTPEATTSEDLALVNR